MAPRALWWMVLIQCLIHFRLVDAAASKCYYPDGSAATGDSPCNPNADVSACCGSSSDSTCLNNNLCEDGKGRVIRGSCSDQSWSDPACPRYCLSFKFGGEDLIPCTNVTKDNVSYCCDGAIDNCCNSGDGRFQVLPYPTSAIATWNAAATQFKLLPGVSISSSTSSSSTVSSSTTTTTLPSSTTSSAPTTPPPSSSSAAPDTSTGNSGLSTGAQAGIGVGVAGGVVLAALLGYLFWRVQKTQNALKEQQALNSHQHQMTSYTPNTTMADNGASDQYKSPDPPYVPPPQPTPFSELSSEGRTYELPAGHR
ncbi:hypothetical protein F4859DRAFT_491027 [Xylaria cf. heliscus]|nr:hypothetical protein F4859DRAFT_491027 [Xylaria cf. heliscus]